MEKEYIGDIELYKCMDTLKDMITSGKFSDDVKQEIYETIKCYVEGKHRLDPETVSCLFTGFIIRSMLPKQKGIVDPEAD